MACPSEWQTQSYWSPTPTRPYKTCAKLQTRNQAQAEAAAVWWHELRPWALISGMGIWMHLLQSPLANRLDHCKETNSQSSDLIPWAVPIWCVLSPEASKGLLSCFSCRGLLSLLQCHPLREDIFDNSIYSRSLSSFYSL